MALGVSYLRYSLEFPKQTQLVIVLLYQKASISRYTISPIARTRLNICISASKTSVPATNDNKRLRCGQCFSFQCPLVKQKQSEITEKNNNEPRNCLCHLGARP